MRPIIRTHTFKGIKDPHMARTVQQLTLTLCLSCLLSASARAQTGFYALGSGARLSGTNIGASTLAGASGNFTAYGETFGVYSNWAHFARISLGADFHLSFQSTANNTPYGNKVRDGALGLRVGFKTPLLPLRPYVQAGLALGTTNYGQYPSEDGSAGTGYEIGGGIDYTVLPHLDLRAMYSAGELYGSASRLGSANLNLQHVAVGIVLRR